MNREKNKKREWSQTVATWIPPPIGTQFKKTTFTTNILVHFDNAILGLSF